jgi:hypothetical protein
MVIAGLAGHLAADQPARALEVEHEDLRFQQGGGDVLALLRLLALEQRDQNAERAKQPCGEVGDRDADAHRPLPRQAGDRHQSAHALRDLVEARSAGVGTALAESGNAGIDELGVDLAQLRIVDAEPAFHVGTEILDHHVGFLHHALERRQGCGRLEIERDAALVAVQILKVGPFARAAERIAGAGLGR